MSIGREPIPNIDDFSRDRARIEHIVCNSSIIPDYRKQEIAAETITDLIVNKHPLNKLWRNEQGEITGFMFFQDSAPDELYIKSFLTDESGIEEGILTFVPDLISRSKELGYKKIHFHGINYKLNRVMTRFNFKPCQENENPFLVGHHLELIL